jgi:hypothetical protein
MAEKKESSCGAKANLLTCSSVSQLKTNSFQIPSFIYTTTLLLSMEYCYEMTDTKPSMDSFDIEGESQ